MGKLNGQPLPPRTPEIIDHKAWSLPAHTGPPSLAVSFHLAHPSKAPANPHIATSSITLWGSHVVILGGGMRANPSYSSPVLLGWAKERKAKSWEARFLGQHPQPICLAVGTHSGSCACSHPHSGRCHYQKP